MALLLAWALSSGGAFGEESKEPSLSTSRPVAIPRPEWFREADRQRREMAKGGARVCLFGDSLTAFWPTVGVGSWELDLVPLHPLNAGIAGDRVENVHFRIQQATFGKPEPELLIIWCGTNNLGKEAPDPPESVSAGLVALLKTVRAKFPRSAVLVLSILPSGFEPGSPLRQRIRRANELIQAQVVTLESRWLGLHDDFLEVDGRWKAGLTIDGTHLSARGYDLLASKLAPVLREMQKGEETPWNHQKR